MKTINERIKEIIDIMYDGNVSKFARQTGIPQPTLNNIVGTRNSKPSAENLEKIINSIELINERWLLTGEGEMMKQEGYSLVMEPQEGYSEYKSKPFVQNISGVCGHPGGFTSAILRDGHKLITLPINTDYDFAIQASGDSMINRKNPEKSIMSGDILLVKIVRSKSFIQWGEIYCLALQDDVIIKKIDISEKEECIKCISFNVEDGYKPFDVPLSEIYDWGMVKGVVRITNI